MSEIRYGVRRADGEPMYGEYDWVHAMNENDWTAAISDGEDSEPVQYEMIRMEITVVGRRTFGEREEEVSDTLWQVWCQRDMNEGRNPAGLGPTGKYFQTEQDAWDYCNDKGGICGAHPKNWANTSATTWQEYKRFGKSVDWDVRPVTRINPEYLKALKSVY